MTTLFNNAALEGELALVTGASRGIGAAIAAAKKEGGDASGEIAALQERYSNVHAYYDEMQDFISHNCELVADSYAPVYAMRIVPKMFSGERLRLLKNGDNTMQSNSVSLGGIRIAPSGNGSE